MQAKQGCGEGLKGQVLVEKGAPQSLTIGWSGKESLSGTSRVPRRTHRSTRITQVRCPVEDSSAFRIGTEIALRIKAEKKKVKQICGSIKNYTQYINTFFPRRRNKLFVGFTALLIIHI